MKARWSDIKLHADLKGLSIQYVDLSEMYYLKLFDGQFELEMKLFKVEPRSSDQADFEDNYKDSGNKKLNIREPFASKFLPDGKSLYQRVEGKSFTLTTAANDNILEYKVPYALVKFTELEIIGADIGDRVILNILDDDLGTLTTVAKTVVNTFGGNDSKVCVAPDFYRRGSEYDAELFIGLYVQIKYETISDKDIYVNYVFHEVV